MSGTLLAAIIVGAIFAFGIAVTGSGYRREDGPESFVGCLWRVGGAGLIVGLLSYWGIWWIR